MPPCNLHNLEGFGMNEWEASESLKIIFDSIEDPRINRTKKYPLNEILFLSLSAVLCGMDGWRNIEEYGLEKLDVLKKYFPFINGIPSFQTIGRVFSLIPPASFEALFMHFMQSVSKSNIGEIIAIDGKTLRRSYDKGDGICASHLLNVWAVKQGICLGQMDVGEKTNEITVVPQVLEHLDIRGAIVTVDALNTQREIAEKIIEKGGDYLMPVKGNHPGMEESLKTFFDREDVNLIPTFSQLQTTDKGHGRIETRDFYCVRNITYIKNQENWNSLNTLCKVVSTVFRNNEEHISTKYYITSLLPNVKVISEAVRGHWGIENGLHWVLDVTFGEDQSRKRKDHAPRNFSLLRKMALNIMKKDRGSKSSLDFRRKKAGMNDKYFDQMIMKAGFLQCI